MILNQYAFDFLMLLKQEMDLVSYGAPSLLLFPRVTQSRGGGGGGAGHRGARGCRPPVMAWPSEPHSQQSPPHSWPIVQKPRRQTVVGADKGAGGRKRVNVWTRV